MNKQKNEFEVITGYSSIEVKRFYLPYIIKVDCPKCGVKIEHDLCDQYLSYPNINSSEKVWMCCNDCDTEFEVPITLQISIKVDAHEAKICE